MGYLALILMIIAITIYFSFASFIAKNKFERLLAINAISNILIALFCMLSFVKNNRSFIDVALIYGLLNYITNFCFLKFYRDKEF